MTEASTTQTTPAAPSRKTRPASMFHALQTVIGVGIVVATLFTMWTPTNLFSNQLLDRWFQSLSHEEQPVFNYPTPTALPPVRIGIVAGHKNNDSGAVCPDGLREVDVNTQIASLVQGQLTELGYQVDLLDEFDNRLYEYQAMALVSIHNDSCEYVNEEATGFKVSAAKSSLYPEKANRLEACLTNRYQAASGMTFHANTITADMTDYHTFREIHSDTTAAIIETGFLYMDREVLTKSPDRLAEGITAGIVCFIRNENIETPAPTPAAE